MELENYHIEPDGAHFVYYYNPTYGASWDAPGSEILIKTRFVSLNTLLRIANQHHHRSRNA